MSYENLSLYDEVRRLNEALEARVEERTAQLRAANTNLAAFNASVSHDLRNPLMAICGFADILIERHATTLPPDSRACLTHISESGRHMNALIDDLLAFAHLGSVAMPLTPVPLDPLIRQVRATLHMQAEVLRGGIHVERRLPTVLGHPTLLQQVFANLVNNALKYARPDEPPEVVVGCMLEEHHCVVTVRDNGIGIPADQRDKVFEMFRRLPDHSHKPGNGVGLALVKKAVQLMKGEVWADSVVGTGSIFSVRLPLAPAEPAKVPENPEP